MTKAQVGKQYQLNRYIRRVALLMVTLFLCGCNLLGISPQRRNAPVQVKQQETGSDHVKKQETGSEPRTEDKQANREELLERIEELESRMERDKSEYVEYLKRMDRTIALLEKNIQQLQQQSEQQVSSLKEQLKKNTKQEKPDIQGNHDSAPGNTETASIPGQLPNISTEIRTPQSSKAIETISLSKPNKQPQQEIEIKQPKAIAKLPIIGLETEPKKPTPAIGEESWEDPDLDESSSPVKLSIVSGAKLKYQQAFKIYSGRNYEEAIKQFDAFLVDFPNDQDADNSQFWIGQCHFQLGNYFHAEAAFRKVLRNYYHGPTRSGYKTPDAILMLGRIYLIRKKPIKARYYFEQVLKRYPGSRSAVKGERELEAMDSF